ncbi:hypothetical protein RND81_11G194900 [Saponaria officinalis]|uniref:Transmembrane protein n=1 Tax=Saponaria officinalis TaxID=3572 RepID=A0AAW1HPJ3_SAPOF
MHDWASPLIASALFAFLQPGLLVQVPGKQESVGFMNMKTSIASIIFHAIIYGLLLMLFLVVLDIHVYV